MAPTAPPLGSKRALAESRKRKPTGNAGATIKAKGMCGAKKRLGGDCTLAPGWGTSHPGQGKCKFHGGSTPTHVKAAAKSEYRKLLGEPIEIHPLDAILACIKIRYGEVVWLTDRMHALEEKHWIEETMVGKQFHLYARERQAAMSDLARFSGMAVSLGIAERAIKMAEIYGEQLYRFSKGVLDDLWPYLSLEGQANAQMIVRRHLILLDGGVPDDGLPVIDQKAIEAAA